MNSRSNVKRKSHKRSGRAPSYNSAYHDQHESSEGYSLLEHVRGLEIRVQQLESDNRLLLKGISKLFP